MSASPHVCIAGPSMCGKTFAAKVTSLARWRTMSRRSLVLDLNGEYWGRHSLVYTLPPRISNPPEGVLITKEERDAAVCVLRDQFLAKMWSHRDLDVFIDECTETVGRDADLSGVFTRGRHRGHVIYAMCHRATVLLPIQRDQFGTLMLFQQSSKAAVMWAEDWGDRRLLQAEGMKAYEFLLCRKFGAPDRSHYVKAHTYPANYLANS